jgi:exonuclease III
MNLNLISYNVRGLNDQMALDTLHHYLHGIMPKIDILMLQEHKLRNTQALQLGAKLWRGATMWCLDATVGYNNGPLDAGASKGGLATFLAPQRANLVSNHGTVLQNRVHWFVLRGTLGGDTGFLNIYTPNDSQEKCILWEPLILLLPTTCRWVVAGDFNMVETRSDKTNQCGKLIPF